MSHQKVDSQGSIAFSWEDSPGVPKYFTHQKLSSSYNFNVEKIPPLPAPPCSSRPPVSRGTSMRCSPRDDPFVAALIECTKSVGNSERRPIDYEPRKNIGSSKGSKKSYLCIFSCKQSSDDVKVGNLVTLSNLPPIPRTRGRRYRALTNVDED